MQQNLRLFVISAAFAAFSAPAWAGPVKAPVKAKPARVAATAKARPSFFKAPKVWTQFRQSQKVRANKRAEKRAKRTAITTIKQVLRRYEGQLHLESTGKNREVSLGKGSMDVVDVFLFSTQLSGFSGSRVNGATVEAWVARKAILLPTEKLARELNSQADFLQTLAETLSEGKVQSDKQRNWLLGFNEAHHIKATRPMTPKRIKQLATKTRAMALRLERSKQPRTMFLNPLANSTHLRRTARTLEHELDGSAIREAMANAIKDI